MTLDDAIEITTRMSDGVDSLLNVADGAPMGAGVLLRIRAEALRLVIEAAKATLPSTCAFCDAETLCGHRCIWCEGV